MSHVDLHCYEELPQKRYQKETSIEIRKKDSLTVPHDYEDYVLDYVFGDFPVNTIDEFPISDSWDSLMYFYD